MGDQCGKQKRESSWMTSSQPFCFPEGSGRSILLKAWTCLVFLKASSDGVFILPRHSRKSSESSATSKTEAEQGKVFLPSMKSLEKQKSKQEKPRESFLMTPVGRQQLAATSASACADELQVLPSHKSMKFPFTLIFMGSHSNISKVSSSLLHYSWER